MILLKKSAFLPALLSFAALTLVGCGKEKSKQIRIAPTVGTTTQTRTGQTSVPSQKPQEQAQTTASTTPSETPQPPATAKPPHERQPEKQPDRTNPTPATPKPDQPRPDTPRPPRPNPDGNGTTVQNPPKPPPVEPEQPPQPKPDPVEKPAQTPAAEAKGLKWVKLGVPGAKCGNGDQYVIFVDKRALEQDSSNRSRKMLLMFQGGGACWDEESCFKHKLSRLNPPDHVVASEEFARDPEAMFSADPNLNAFTSYSKIFFPYCTGDVFLGQHEADYGGKKVFHHGRLNIETTLQYLQSNQFLFNFQNTEDVVLFGFSAGAIAALYHLNTFADAFQWAPRKSMISDSPGLFFGPTFWHRFSDQFVRDTADALAKYNHPVDRDNGLLSPIVPKICRQFPNWNIGFLQASQDPVMSFIFGEIDPKEHERLMLGPYGLSALTADSNDNCSSWVEKANAQGDGGGHHTFLVMDNSAKVKIGGISAMEYAWKVAQGQPVPNYLGSMQSNPAAPPASSPAQMLLSFTQPVGAQHPQLRQR